MDPQYCKFSVQRTLRKDHQIIVLLFLLTLVLFLNKATAVCVLAPVHWHRQERGQIYLCRLVKCPDQVFLLYSSTKSSEMIKRQSKDLIPVGYSNHLLKCSLHNCISPKKRLEWLMFENKQEVLVRVDGLTQVMTSARVVETSITVTDNNPYISDYTNIWIFNK